MSALTSPNGTVETDQGSEDLLDGLEIALRARLDQLGAERGQLIADHKRRLSRLDHEIQRHHRVLRVVDPNAPKPGKKKQNRDRSNYRGTPQAAIIRCAKAILTIETEQFTVRDINVASGAKPDSAQYYGAVNRFRQDEVIALAGIRNNHQKFWRLMPDGREKLEQIANG